MHCKCMATARRILLCCGCSGKAKYCMATTWQLRGESCCGCSGKAKYCSESCCGFSGKAKYCMATAWQMHCKCIATAWQIVLILYCIYCMYLYRLYIRFTALYAFCLLGCITIYSTLHHTAYHTCEARWRVHTEETDELAGSKAKSRREIAAVWHQAAKPVCVDVVKIFLKTIEW